jgi:hypothetical protein
LHESELRANRRAEFLSRQWDLWDLDLDLSICRSVDLGSDLDLVIGDLDVIWGQDYIHCTLREGPKAGTRGIWLAHPAEITLALGTT